MTTNQINYWNLKNEEAKLQHEREKLKETERSNREKEAIEWDKRKAENFMVPYNAAVATRTVSEKHANQLEKVTKALKNIFDPLSSLFGG